MSYNSNGARGTNHFLIALDSFIDALKEAGDPMFWEINPAAIRWLNEELKPLGYKVMKYKREELEDV